MPRRSAADLSTSRIDTGSDRLKPPAALSPEARKVFVAIVGSVAAQHFAPADVHLLSRYAVALVLSERAEAALETGGCVIEDKPSPWVAVLEKQVRNVALLSTKLRLAPQSRIDSRAAGRHASDKASAYELLRLAGHDA